MDAVAKPIPLPDYHMHTHLCRHAEGEPSSYRTAAAIQGIPEICFTDHCPYPDGYDPSHRMEFALFHYYRQMITELQDDGSPSVLFGIEADYYGGCEDFLGNWLPAQHFDFVLGSVHYIGNWGFDNPDQQKAWDSIDVKSAWEEYFRLIGTLADTRLFDAVGHLDLPKKFGHRPKDRYLKEMAQPVLDKIAEAGMGIELNTSGLRKPVGEIYPSPLLLSLACEREIPICFGSDAHTPEEIGAGFDQALKLAHEIGYTDCFIIRQRKRQSQNLP